MPLGALQNEADLERWLEQKLGNQFGLLSMHRIAGLHGEDWHEVGASGEPAYQNGWSGSARFRKDALGVVHLEGTVSGGSASNTAAFTLPSGYRPDVTTSWVIARPLIPGDHGEGHAHARIQDNGLVRIRTVAPSDLHDLAGVSFRAAS